ncbi:hypothetical protein [Halocatena halophila]|uniref:hypothetical protein n=1 Tax=Halocatena halophila TaxID=2814576 RepID=UPI002ED322D8
MTRWFPSEEWLEAYQGRLNANEDYIESSDGWGEEFLGSFIFEINGLPLTETTIGELPDELTAPFRTALTEASEARIETLRETAPPALAQRLDEATGEPPRDRLITALFDTAIVNAPDVVSTELRVELPDDLENLLDQLDRYAHDDTVYAYLDLEDGRCNEAAVLEDPDTTTAGFVLSAQYQQWTELIDGADVIEAVMSRDMSLDGDITNVIIYPEAAQEMGDTAGRLETTFLF